MKYKIDSVIKDSDKNLIIIKGWGINDENNDEVSIEVLENSNIISSLIKRNFRGDLTQAYHLPIECSCGFVVAIKVLKFNGKVEINLFDEKERITLKYALFNFWPNNNSIKTGWLFTKTCYRYVKGIGLKKVFRKLKRKIMTDTTEYKKWRDANENYNLQEIQKEVKGLKYRPMISILIPVYNVNPNWLEKCIDSVRRQVYENWELCIADDASTDKRIKETLKKYQRIDNRIKVVYREENGHISEATNSALRIAEGEFVGLLDNDDELSPYALYEVVKLLNENEEVDLIYSDEDKLSEGGNRSNPFFKSDWAPDTLLSVNYICHFGVYRKSIVEEIGGFRKGFEGAQDYDLVLRFTEKTNKIFHIPKVLYHWRMVVGSTAFKPNGKNYAYNSGKKALEEALQRRKIKATVTQGAYPGIYNINYEIENEGMVSIIIPTRDGAEDVELCVNSIFEKTIYPNFEIIIADNGSVEEKTLKLFDDFKEKYPEQFKVVRIDIPFNYPKINNIAAATAKGEYILFLNNDTEVITKGWLKKLVSVGQLEHVGAVGAKLYYPDDTVQHAGVVLGLGGGAGHIHYGADKEDLGYFGKLSLTGNYMAVTAACLLVKRKDFEAIQGFNEAYTVAFNDVDLCLKLYKLGKYNVWVHDVELYHFESKSRGYEETYEKKTRFESEVELLRSLWMEYIINDPFYNPNLTRTRSDVSIRVEE